MHWLYKIGVVGFSIGWVVCLIMRPKGTYNIGVYTIYDLGVEIFGVGLLAIFAVAIRV